MEIRIELATMDDVPALLDLQLKAYRLQCEEYGWVEESPMTESLEQVREEFERCTTLKVGDEDGRIIGSVRGYYNSDDDSLYIGRLMVLPEYQQRGIGRRLLREIHLRVPHRRAWLCTCRQLVFTYKFYLQEGFKPFRIEEAGPRLTWIYMERRACRW